ncbi:uncharacterized protein RSE6_10118 [Rhynchosporium secalis]|uniref:Uncharacterized protein n=1 Tax=Rhynchosporium secalis TaxID=38038 RepID=A0A1E1MJQ0_RHYSE|nr:uncharacterized protein RSE6_10118 [Rhynchosporium secalis]
MDLGIMVLPWSISAIPLFSKSCIPELVLVATISTMIKFSRHITVYGVLNEIPKPPFVGNPSAEKKRYSIRMFGLLGNPTLHLQTSGSCVLRQAKKDRIVEISSDGETFRKSPHAQQSVAVGKYVSIAKFKRSEVNLIEPKVCNLSICQPTGTELDLFPTIDFGQPRAKTIKLYILTRLPSRQNCKIILLIYITYISTSGYLLNFHASCHFLNTSIIDIQFRLLHAHLRFLPTSNFECHAPLNPLQNPSL